MNTKLIDDLYARINDLGTKNFALRTKNFALRGHLSYLSGYIGSSVTAGVAVKNMPMTSDHQAELARNIDKVLGETK